MTNILEPADALICPSADPSKPPVTVDIRQIRQVEARIADVAIVTLHKAPELLAIFNKAYLDVHNLIVSLNYELLKAEERITSIKAVLLFDKAPEFFKSKNLSSSKDLRDIFVESDPEFQAATLIAHQIRAIIELLKGKAKAFEMAYTSVKKIIGGDAYDQTRTVGRTNPNLSGDTGTTLIGKAKY